MPPTASRRTPLLVVLPPARRHAGRLGVAAGVVLLQVGVLLLRPWPLALAVDHALDRGATPAVLPVIGSISAVGVLVLAALATVVLSIVLGRSPPCSAVADP